MTDRLLRLALLLRVCLDCALLLVCSFHVLQMDGETHISVVKQSWPIPGPGLNATGTVNGTVNGCPYCGPKLPDNATRLMRKA